MEEWMMTSQLNLQYMLGEMAKLQSRVEQPPAPAPMTWCAAEPAKPSEFNGDREKGCTFFNSCLLYLHACRVDFTDDQTKILWVLSFMKSGWAAVFADRAFAKEACQNQPAYLDWASFKKELRSQFLPLHEHIHAINTLELTAYCQAKWMADVYIDEFEMLVEQAGYSEGLAIVMKFWVGLYPSTQLCITNMLENRPPDDQPTAWYEAAWKVTMAKVANEAFQVHHAPTAPAMAKQTQIEPLNPQPMLLLFPHPILPSFLRPTPPQCYPQQDWPRRWNQPQWRLMQPKGGGR
jgi:hypothetical protein